MRARHVTAGMAAVLLGAVACGSSAGSNTAAGSGGQSGSCKQSDEVKIGAVLPLSGAAAEGGKQMRAGIDIAVSDVNKAGGILGRCVTIIYEDSQANPTTAGQVTRQAVDQDGAQFVVGVLNSSEIAPVSQVTTQAKVPLLVGATDTIDYKTNPYVFRNEVTVAQIGAEYVHYMADVLKIKKFGILAVDNAYGQGVANAVKAAVPAAGLAITSTQFFPADALTLESQTRAIKDSGAQALVTVVYGQAAVVALKAREAVGWTDAPAFGSNGFATADIVKAVGEAGLKNLFVSPTYKKLNRAPGASDVDNPALAHFRDQLKAKLGVNPLNDLIQQYVGGYDMIRIFAAAANGAKSTAASKVTSYLEQNGYNGIKADYVFKHGNHDGVPSKDIDMAVATSLKDGTLESAPQ